MRTEINIRNALLQNRIGIHLALGGDFATEESRSENQLLPGPIAAETTSDLAEEPESASETE